MKKIVILYGRGDWSREAPRQKEMYVPCYNYFYRLLNEAGFEVYRASYQWYDERKKSFDFAWKWESGSWKRAENIVPDVVYDKMKQRMEAHFFKERLGADFPVLNNPEFTVIANNKLYASLLFPEYFKPYYLIQDEKQLEKVSAEIKGDLIVAKQAVGSGGEQVSILPKSAILSLKMDYPFLLQEFIDTSAGITDIAKGTHDLRMVFINEELIYSYVRQPKEGSLLANLAQGGSMFIVEEKDLPESLLPIIARVQKTFSVYQTKIYTIDVMFDREQRPWIIELNTTPGMYFSPDQEKYMKKMYLALIKVLQESSL